MVMIVTCLSHHSTLNYYCLWFLGAENAQLISTARDLLARVRGLERSHRLEFLKVKAHSENKWNDRADELAKLGAGMTGMVSKPWRRNPSVRAYTPTVNHPPARHETPFALNYITEESWDDADYGAAMFDER